MKEFLSQNKIEFTDRNIAGDEAALDELEKLGYMTTPVTVIDGEASENRVAGRRVDTKRADFAFSGRA